MSLFEFKEIVPVSPGIPEGLCAKRIVGKKIDSRIVLVFIAFNFTTN
jgi:hypothetical protein